MAASAVSRMKLCHVAAPEGVGVCVGVKGKEKEKEKERAKASMVQGCPHTSAYSVVKACAAVCTPAECGIETELSLACLANRSW